MDAPVPTVWRKGEGFSYGPGRMAGLPGFGHVP